MTAPNTIMLTGNFVREEDEAGGTITPGMLIEKYNDSGSAKVRAHATAGGFAERAFAVEDPLQGKTATSVQSRTIDDDYVVTEKVQYNIVAPGSRVRAILKDGEVITIGERLVSAGDGTLQAEDTLASALAARQIIAIAEEALDLSGSPSATGRITVRVV